MRGKQKKQDKKQIVDRIRRFISGEDITGEIVPLSNAIAFLTIDELNKLRMVKRQRERHGIESIQPGWEMTEDGIEVRYEDVIQIDAKLRGAIMIMPENYRGRPDPIEASKNEVFIWAEEKTYPDPDVADVYYSNPANILIVDGNGQILENIESSEHSGRIKREVTGEAVNALKKQARINEKILEMNNIKEITKARRDKMEEYKRINQEWFY